MDEAEASAKNAKLARRHRISALEKELNRGETPEERAERQKHRKFKDPVAPKKKEPEVIVLGGDDFGRLRPRDSTR